MAIHGKKFQEAAKQVDRAKAYAPQEAIDVAKKAAFAKFDETVEVHMRMGVDSRQADQQVRGVATLPHGLGKTVRVLVFAVGDTAKAAQDAGADFVGGDELIAKVDGGWVEFDVAMATPDIMGKVGKLGKVLGRKGLMPNPKSGTVVQAKDVAKAIVEARKGRVEFRLDKTGIIHVPVGKASFDSQKLADNVAALVDAVNKARPAGAKGQYIRTVFLKTTMGPSVKLDVAGMLTKKVE
ncbi:MAG: 50S ribosomal protein L1 [Dehalococcoidia bacterium]|nr:50S ribosomal protein L1 [Dehalococcoidia bacterium]